MCNLLHTGIDMPTFVLIGLTVLIGLAVLAKLFQKKAVCPHCGHGTIRSFEAAIPGRCDRCGDYARIVDGKGVRIDSGFVTAFPRFEVRLGDLAHPAEWADPWPGRCCVCGAQTNRQVSFESQMLAGVQRGFGTTFTTSKVYKLGLGCCQECEKPFDSELLNPPALKEIYPDIPMMFRSYDFWRAFLASNGKRRTLQSA
jgi:hypothetical protein